MSDATDNSSEVRKLEMRLTELENQLGQVSRSKNLPDISTEEMQAYLKVKGLVEIDPACGINECSRCIVNCIAQCNLCIARCVDLCIRCVRCDFECICGPCNGGFGGGFGGGGGGRFNGLGG
jgi:hypothetical protein